MQYQSSFFFFYMKDNCNIFHLNVVRTLGCQKYSIQHSVLIASLISFESILPYSEHHYREKRIFPCTVYINNKEIISLDSKTCLREMGIHLCISRTCRLRTRVAGSEPRLLIPLYYSQSLVKRITLYS